MVEATLKDYLALMRLNKPIGIWLVFFPAAWGALLASPKLDIALLLVLLIGAVVTRSAGCILNDLADRKLDASVERTRERPLASGKVGVKEAYVLLGALLATAFVIALSLPLKVMLVAILAVPMIAAYPFMKRITFWPQLFLGLTFNLGALMGWLATGEPLAPAAFLLYAACIFWTLAYDTIYAIQDMEDDTKAGVKSTALLLGDKIPLFVTVCFGAMLVLFGAAAFLAKMGFLFLSAAAVAIWHIERQLKGLKQQPVRAGAIFVSNQWLGLVLTAFLLVYRLFMR